MNDMQTYDNTIRAYLDEKIRYWEGELKTRMEAFEVPHGNASAVAAEKAISYIDAYVTMKCDLFGGGTND